MNCCKCGHDIPEGENYCQFCGFNNVEDNPKRDVKDKPYAAIFVVIGMIALIVLVIFVGLYKKKEHERRVLEVLNNSNFSEEMQDSYNQFYEEVDELNKEIDEKSQELQQDK